MKGGQKWKETEQLIELFQEKTEEMGSEKISDNISGYDKI